VSKCQPAVSVVMAAKNYAKFLPQAVASVQAQTFTDWELIIVDDGSTDQTPEVVKPFLQEERIRYFRSDKLGQSRAKNLGVKLSQGRLIAFLDADDAWHADKLSLQVECLRQHPTVGVCFTRRILMDESGNTRRANDPPAPSGAVFNEIFLRNFVCFSSVMIRREAFEQVGGFNPTWDLSIDYDLWLRISPLYEFQQLDEPLTLYRTGHGNLSKKLADRVSTAFAIMDQRDWDLPRSILREGYASTYRSLAYVMRSSEPRAALRLYWQALIEGGVAQKEVWKGAARTVLNLFRRSFSSGENATVNR
jgi:glycosyltransferase involved in cell wall biosynthesis